MKYYVVADVHGYYTELITALTRADFFKETKPHKLIVCGDLFDRGKKAVELQKFIMDLLEKDMVILIKGNHEDLTEELIRDWYKGSFFDRAHIHNGTVQTMLDLTGCEKNDLCTDHMEVKNKFLETPYITKIIPKMVDYFETDHYIFVHGWIPCDTTDFISFENENLYMPSWRNMDEDIRADKWRSARWINGMAEAHYGIIEPDKTIVCGHWHCSFGHASYEKDGGAEYGPTANYDPYYAKGIIALDACTITSKKVNCIVIED